MIATVFDLEIGTGASFEVADRERFAFGGMLWDIHDLLAAISTDQPYDIGSLGVAGYDICIRQGGSLVRVSLRHTAGQYDECLRIVPPETAKQLS